jgi:hypothetical protein
VSQSSPAVVLASGRLNRSGDTISIELISRDAMPAVVRIVWPAAATITTPARYLEVASTAMRLLAEASTTLTRIKASKRLNGFAWADRPQVFQDLSRLPLVGPPSPRYGAAVKAYTYTGRTSRLLGHSASKGRGLSSGRA